MNSTDKPETLFLGAQAVIDALSGPAFVVDAQSVIYGCNREAKQMLGRRVPARLQELLSIPEEVCLHRLRAMTRSNATRLLRLELPGHLPMIFRGKLLHGARPGQKALILLVGDSSGGTLGSFIELQTERQAMPRCVDQSQKRNNALREEALWLKFLSETDPSTGLFNLRAFEERVRRVLAERPERLGVLAIIHLNDVGALRQEIGHATGQELLKAAAKKLTFPVQTKIVTARIGGDELALWIPDLSLAARQQMVCGLRDRIGGPLTITMPNGRAANLRPQPAIGTAFCPGEAKSYRALCQLARQRMLEDTQAGSGPPIMAM